MQGPIDCRNAISVYFAGVTIVITILHWIAVNSPKGLSSKTGTAKELGSCFRSSVSNEADNTQILVWGTLFNRDAERLLECFSGVILWLKKFWNFLFCYAVDKMIPSKRNESLDWRFRYCRLASPYEWKLRIFCKKFHFQTEFFNLEFQIFVLLKEWF